MSAGFQWHQPRYGIGDPVIFLRGRFGQAVEGVIQDVTTSYDKGRSRHVYRIKPHGLKNCANVAEGMIKRRGERSAYGAVRYYPTRTASDSRTDIHDAR